MKFSGEFILAFLLIALGVILLVRQIFGITIPIFKILIGLFFVYLGFSIIFGGFGIRAENTLVFTSGTFKVEQLESDYNLIFSSGDVNLLDVTPDHGRQKTEVNVIFSSGRILVDPDTPVIMRINSVFGSADVPDRNVSGFGSQDYRTEGVGDEAKDPIEIKANVVFSSLKVVEQRRPQ